MRIFPDRMARLAAKAGTWPASSPMAGSAGRLKPLTGFGSNPGKLAALHHLPEGLAPGAPLVVVLHGCTQSAAAYDLGSGWSSLADEYGFAVLYPEQQGANNPNRCFNWFDPAQVTRDAGEALSIMQMVDAMISSNGLAADKVYVTGLSAGGAMAAAMLATYPERFAAGAIIAGLPYGSARTVPQAFQRMRGQAQPSPEELAAAVRSASAHKGRWPSLSVWQGTADRTVHPSNADAIIAQWALLHGLDSARPLTARIAGHEKAIWAGPDGQPVISSWRISSLGHGTPIKASGPDSAGAPGPYMLEAGISSTREIARSWGLMAEEPARSVAKAPLAKEARARPPQVKAPENVVVSGKREEAAPPLSAPAPAGKARPAPHHGGLLRTIEDALRAAGLMR